MAWCPTMIKSICALCAINGKSCCQGTQICLTSGDVRRISQYLADDGFAIIENADPGYTDPGDEPGWIALTIRPDGTRRVLMRTENQICIMLGKAGCRLPMHVRPLVCRLHPYVFTETGISGIDQCCLIAKEADWTGVLQQLGMTMDDACQWHRLLYCELHGEDSSGPGDDCEKGSAESEEMAASSTVDSFLVYRLNGISV